MAYQVLARKYRPQRFSDVVGQEHVTRTLLNGLAQGRIAHGYIFSGHRGIGKTTIARILAMALNCRTEVGSAARPTPEPCGVCESCTEVRAGNAVDVIEIDAATNRGIDEIRELRDAARYRPARDRYKIYILDEAHQITDAAFNALLKTLEEPPAHVVFMMATTQPEDIPQTIRSRCQHFSFHAVKFDDILAQLRTIAVEEQIAAGDDALALLAEAGDGSMRDALSIMDQAIASAPASEGRTELDAGQIRELMGTVPNTVFERLMEAIGENQSGPVIEEANRLLNAGNSASQLARQFVRYLRNVLMARIAGEQTELLQLSPDERARVARSGVLFSEEDLTRFLAVMLRTFDELNYRQEPRFHLELGLLKLVHLQRLLPVEQLLSQMGGAPAAKLGGGPLPGASGGGGRAGGGRVGAGLIREVGATAAGPGPGSSGARGVGAETAVAPAFSPFEQDSRRKGPERGSLAPAAEGIGSPAMLPETKPGRTFNGHAVVPSVRIADETAGVKEAELHELKRSEVRLPAAAVEAAGAPSAPGEAPPTAAMGEASEGMRVVPEAAGSDLNKVRDSVCAALEQAGHSTAAALLSSGIWTDTGAEIQVRVAAKKTMLGLAMNVEAERICREAMRTLAGGERPRALLCVPGDGSVSPSRAVPAEPGLPGGVQARAMEHPLVRQAQELFGAEVRSVVDLRSK